jgi:hypothetical protein
MRKRRPRVSKDSHLVSCMMSGPGYHQVADDADFAALVARYEPFAQQGSGSNYAAPDVELGTMDDDAPRSSFNYESIDNEIPAQRSTPTNPGPAAPPTHGMRDYHSAWISLLTQPAVTATQKVEKFMALERLFDEFALEATQIAKGEGKLGPRACSASQLLFSSGLSPDSNKHSHRAGDCQRTALGAPHEDGTAHRRGRRRGGHQVPLQWHLLQGKWWGAQR